MSARKDDVGGCWLSVTDPSEDTTTDYSLTEQEGIVSGHASFVDINECTSAAAIVGKRTPISKQDLLPTDAEKKQRLDMIFNEGGNYCRALPFAQVPNISSHSWEIDISAEGGTSRVLVDGVDQHVAELCDPLVVNNSEHWPTLNNRTEAPLTIRGRSMLKSPPLTAGTSPAQREDVALPRLPQETTTSPQVSAAAVRTLPKIDTEACANTISYPQKAQDALVEGEVKMRVSLDAHGKVEDITVLSGPGHGLEEAAVNALKNRCHFEPARDVNGKAIPYVIPLYSWVFELPR